MVGVNDFDDAGYAGTGFGLTVISWADFGAVNWTGLPIGLGDAFAGTGFGFEFIN